MFKIALVGDYNKDIVAHLAIPSALQLASESLDLDITWSWVDTSKINSDNLSCLSEFSAIWVVPGSPYLNMEGALCAIRFARETRRPFLGTCGGFQHALIEYARNVCGISVAEHAETNPESAELIVVPLLCSLVEKTGQISFTAGSHLHSIFKGELGIEGYYCNYGLNPLWKDRLEASGLSFTGFDNIGDIRAFELPTHPFFIGTLFQPERSALYHQKHPLIQAFVAAAIRNIDCA